MCLGNHPAHRCIYLLISCIAHQPHHRQWQSPINLPVTYQYITSLIADQFLHCQHHIMVIITNYNDIVGIMGHTGCNGTASDPVSFHNSNAHFSGIFVPLDHRDLLIFSIRYEKLLSILLNPWNFFDHVFRHYLSFQHTDHMSLCSRMFQLQTFFTETGYMNGIFQIWRTWFYFRFLIPDDLLSAVIYICHIQICHIIQNYKVCLPSGSDHTKSV